MWDGLSETKVRRIHSPFIPVFMPVPARGFALLRNRNRITVSSGKGLNFITNDVNLLLKYDGNYNW